MSTKVEGDTNNAQEKTSHDNQPVATPPIAEFNGAALVDENGNEIPITEKMVQEAIAELQQPDEN